MTCLRSSHRNDIRIETLAFYPDVSLTFSYYTLLKKMFTHSDYKSLFWLHTIFFLECELRDSFTCAVASTSIWQLWLSRYKLNQNSDMFTEFSKKRYSTWDPWHLPRCILNVFISYHFERKRLLILTTTHTKGFIVWHTNRRFWYYMI